MLIHELLNKEPDLIPEEAPPIILESKFRSGWSKRGVDGDTGIGSGNGFGASPHNGGGRERHQGGGVPGIQWFQQGRVEQGGGLSLL